LVEHLLKAYPNAIAGMKDSSGDWNYTKTFLEAFAESGRSVTDSPSKAGGGFDVFVGSETFLLANMRNGGAGTISATANVNPAAIDALYAECSRNQTWAIGHEASALESQQARLNVVRDVFSSREFPSMIAAIKKAIAIHTNDPEWARMRPPLVELTTEQAKFLAGELQTIGFAMREIRQAKS
jgi:4-hydroxy-tetrahydrodipicolinate synthase